MPTHAELTSKLLRDAATFFRTLAQNNEEIKDQMSENARVFDDIAARLEADPQGYINEAKLSDLAGRLLKDAAAFFKTLADQNESIQEQMAENAKVFEQLGDLVTANPLCILD